MVAKTTRPAGRAPARVVPAHGALCLSGTRGRLASGCQRQRQPWAGARVVARRDRVSIVLGFGRSNVRAWLPGACSPAEANRGPESALYSGARGMVIAENRIKRSGRPFASFRCRRSASRSRASERRGVAACVVQDPGSDLALAGRAYVTYVHGGRVWCGSALYPPYRRRIMVVR